jgi:hypothetical protein
LTPDVMARMSIPQSLMINNSPATPGEAMALAAKLAEEHRAKKQAEAG